MAGLLETPLWAHRGQARPLSPIHLMHQRNKRSSDRTPGPGSPGHHTLSRNGTTNSKQPETHQARMGPTAGSRMEGAGEEAKQGLWVGL